ncbi:hypothetical protein GDO81_008760 [Engystomops pustulosus]|uniref:Uncharacterized protein n=1 Tax=Engystomops pustulosus TaxID=76066 RepID=A0AAV7CI17_ENGPU|nr:hypothetical protein GDO81_008760 [Engystomops pustulosus]
MSALGYVTSRVSISLKTFIGHRIGTMRKLLRMKIAFFLAFHRHLRTNPALYLLLSSQLYFLHLLSS